MKAKLNDERNHLLKSIEDLLDGPMIFLGFIWLILLVVELIWGLPIVLQYLSIIIWVIFIIDFLVKFFLAPRKIYFIQTNWLTAISLLIPAIRFLRIFRLFRILRGVRLLRVVSSINRTMSSLGSTMKRRGFGYVVLLAILVMFAGAAGMYALEKSNPGFENYGMALWWTSMRIITAGSDYWPATPEGRGLAFILSLFGFGIFGYVTATMATFFIGRDAEEEAAPVAGSKDVAILSTHIQHLTSTIQEMKLKQNL